VSGVTITRTMRVRAAGLGMLAALGGVVALVAAMMTHAFDSTVEVKLLTDRAGLMMEPKNDVKLNGVVIGRVGDVQLEGDRVAMTLELDPDQARFVAGNARAQISPSTVFGKKFITLSAPSEGARGSVRAGSVLETDHVGVEVNEVLENLNKVLTTAKPSEFNTTLHAMATTLRGKGDRLGDVLVQVGDYARSMNRHLPALRRDLQHAAEVTNLYADVAPELFDLLDNATQISGTVVEKQQALREVLVEVAKVSETGAKLFGENGTSFLEMLRLLEPTSALFGEYSPGLSCFIQGEAHANKLLEPVWGAGEHGEGPGFRLMVNLLPGKQPYRYPDHLPQVRTTGGPQCYGLPLHGNTKIQPKYDLPGSGLDESAGSGEPR
jgi:phospholipid/cholesterol/gamma-HCH transport system substrate-binding protein